MCKCELVVAEGDNFGAVFFDHFEFVAFFSENNNIGPGGFLEVFLPEFFRSVRGFTFYLFDGFVSGDHRYDQWVREAFCERFCLEEQVFVSCVQVIKGAE